MRSRDLCGASSRSALPVRLPKRIPHHKFARHRSFG